MMQTEEGGSIVAESVVFVQMGKTRLSPTPWLLVQAQLCWSEKWYAQKRT